MGRSLEKPFQADRSGAGFAGEAQLEQSTTAKGPGSRCVGSRLEFRHWPTSNDLVLPPVDVRIDGDEYRAVGFYGEALEASHPASN